MEKPKYTVFVLREAFFSAAGHYGSVVSIL